MELKLILASPTMNSHERNNNINLPNTGRYRLNHHQMCKAFSPMPQIHTACPVH